MATIRPTRLGGISTIECPRESVTSRIIWLLNVQASIAGIRTYTSAFQEVGGDASPVKRIFLVHEGWEASPLRLSLPFCVLNQGSLRKGVVLGNIRTARQAESVLRERPTAVSGESPCTMESSQCSCHAATSITALIVAAMRRRSRADRDAVFGIWSVAWEMRNRLSRPWYFLKAGFGKRRKN